MEDVFFLWGSVRSSSLSPVLIMFLAQTCLFKTWAALGASQKFIKIWKVTPSLPGNDQFDQVPRQEKWLSTLNNSEGNTRNHIYLSSTREWVTSRLLTPSPISTNKEVPEFFLSKASPDSSSTSFWFVHSTQRFFSRWWRRRSNYGITNYHNPPVRLVGQSQFPPNLSPTYTISSGSLSGVSLDGKQGKLELDLKQAFDLVGYHFT